MRDAQEKCQHGDTQTLDRRKKQNNVLKRGHEGMQAFTLKCLLKNMKINVPLFRISHFFPLV